MSSPGASQTEASKPAGPKADGAGGLAEQGHEPRPRLSLRSLGARAMGTNSLLILVVLAVLVAAFGIAKPDSFLTAYNIRSIASNAAVLLVLSLGETVVIMTAGIDLSVGSVLVFSSVVTAEIFNQFGGASAGTGGILLGLAGGLAAGLAWGLLNGVLVAKAHIPPLIVTLGSFGAALGLAQVITNGGDLRNVPSSLNSSVGYGQTIGTIPWLVVIALCVTLVMGFFMHSTLFGRYTIAVGSNSEAARRSGIRLGRHLTKVYGLCGLLAGAAGFLALAQFSTTTISGHTTDNLSAVSAVVIGGTSLFGGRGSIFGTVIGVFIPVVLSNGFVIIGVPAFWQSVAIGAVLVLAVYIDQFLRQTQGST